MLIPQSQILYPELKLAVADAKNSRRFLLTAKIDTGYSGILTIPSSFIRKLHLPIVGTIEYQIAGGLIELNQVARGLVFLPQIDPKKAWILDIDADETNSDILIGTGFLQQVCLDLKIKLCLNFAKNCLEILQL